MSKRDIPREMCEDLLELYYSSKGGKIKEGMSFGGCHDGDVVKLVKQALWREGADAVTLRVSKSEDECHLFIEVKKVETQITQEQIDAVKEASFPNFDKIKMPPYGGGK